MRKIRPAIKRIPGELPRWIVVDKDGSPASLQIYYHRKDAVEKLRRVRELSKGIE